MKLWMYQKYLRACVVCGAKPVIYYANGKRYCGAHNLEAVQESKVVRK